MATHYETYATHAHAIDALLSEARSHLAEIESSIGNVSPDDRTGLHRNADAVNQLVQALFAASTKLGRVRTMPRVEIDAA